MLTTENGNAARINWQQLRWRLQRSDKSDVLMKLQVATTITMRTTIMMKTTIAMRTTIWTQDKPDVSSSNASSSNSSSSHQSEVAFSEVQSVDSVPGRHKRTTSHFRAHLGWHIHGQFASPLWTCNCWVMIRRWKLFENDEDGIDDRVSSMFQTSSNVLPFIILIHSVPRNRCF